MALRAHLKNNNIQFNDIKELKKITSDNEQQVKATRNYPGTSFNVNQNVETTTII